MEVFKNNELGKTVWESKYRFNDETIYEFYKRLADNFARLDNFSNVDKNSFMKLSDYGKQRCNKDKNELFLSLFQDFKYIVPGGSVLSGIGTEKPVSLSNCFVLDVDDSIESIFDTAAKMSQIYKRRGGVGVDLSKLRPEGASVNNSAKTTSGVVPFMELFSAVTNTIGQHGRRGALMISLDVNHPDIESFIKAKEDIRKITGANISVKSNKQFMKAVDNDEDYLLTYPCGSDYSWVGDIPYDVLTDVEVDGKIVGYVKKVKAKKLNDTLVTQTWKTGEPGVLLWDNMIEYDLAAVYDKFKPVSTNPCQPGWAVVFTPSGFRTFDEINVGDEIWSSEGWAKVVDKRNNGVKQVYGYHTSAGVFYGTKEHRIISDGQKIEVGEAETIDSLPIRSNVTQVIDFSSPHSQEARRRITSLYYNLINGFEVESMEVFKRLRFESPVNIHNYILELFSNCFNKYDDNTWLVPKCLASIVQEWLSVMSEISHITEVEEVFDGPESINMVKLTRYDEQNYSGKIHTIEKLNEETVYSITVFNKSHTYWTGGLNVANCGEIGLSPYDSCRLITTNLYSLIDNPFTENATLNTRKMFEVFYEAQIIADILVDLELEHVDRILSILDKKSKEFELWTNIKNIGEEGRRTGTGLMGLTDALVACGENYGSGVIIDKIMKTKLEAELTASIDLAIINGAFSAWDSNLEHNRIYEFIELTYPHLYQKMQQYGRRNLSLSTIAPTGSIALLAGVTSGCEPLFSVYYTRRKKLNAGETDYDFVDANGVKFKEFYVIHPKFVDWLTITHGDIDIDKLTKAELDEYVKQSPYYGNTANDVTPDRIKVQSILQKYTTHSISSTVNLPESATIDDIKQLYDEALEYDLKGVTIYRDKSRDGILVTNTSTAGRPTELECKVVHFKNGKQDWVSFVGLLNGQPYEIFTGPREVDTFPIPNGVSSGTIIKIKLDGKPSRYDFRYIDNYGYTNTLGGLSRIFNEEYWNYARMLSGYLRSKIDIPQVINILEGLDFPKKGLNSWKNGVIRSLKEFIPDGTIAEHSVCSECGEKMIYENGCKICKACGNSKC